MYSLALSFTCISFQICNNLSKIYVNPITLTHCGQIFGIFKKMNVEYNVYICQVGGAKILFTIATKCSCAMMTDLILGRGASINHVTHLGEMGVC